MRSVSPRIAGGLPQDWVDLDRRLDSVQVSDDTVSQVTGWLPRHGVAKLSDMVC